MVAKKLFVAWVGLALLQAAAGSEALAQPTGTGTGTGAVGVVRGTVSSSADGEPIADVTVVATGEAGTGTTKTDTRGQFALELTPGLYRVTFSHPAYDERTYLNVEVAPPHR